ALGFLQRDPAAPLRFDNTMEACLRSFRVMALVAPIYALYLLILYSGAIVTADEIDIVFAESARYIVDWLLYPVIFYEIARRRGWIERYPRYISALNWINLPATAIALVLLMLQSIAPPALASILGLGQQALFFYWFLVTTRIVLAASWPIAIVLLVVNWIPSMMLSLIVHRYLGLVNVAAS
ncbi:MAG: hypothetical protein ACREUF_00840, partial [Solimonas sp.]